MRIEIIFALLLTKLCYGQNFMPSGSMSLVDSYVTWTNNGMETEFTITSNFKEQIDPSNAWIALGVNSQRKMSGTNAVVCVNTPSESSVSHHINRGFSSPLFSDSMPMFGLSDTKLNVFNKNLTCSFTRENSIGIEEYFNFDTMTPLHLVVAYGQGTYSYHFGNRGSSMDSYVFANTSMNYTNSFTTRTTPQTPSNNLFGIIFRILIDFFSKLFMGLF